MAPWEEHRDLSVLMEMGWVGPSLAWNRGCFIFFLFWLCWVLLCMGFL